MSKSRSGPVLGRVVRLDVEQRGHQRHCFAESMTETQSARRQTSVRRPLETMAMLDWLLSSVPMPAVDDFRSSCRSTSGWLLCHSRSECLWLARLLFRSVVHSRNHRSFTPHVCICIYFLITERNNDDRITSVDHTMYSWTDRPQERWIATVSWRLHRGCVVKQAHPYGRGRALRGSSIF